MKKTSLDQLIFANEESDVNITFNKYGCVLHTPSCTKIVKTVQEKDEKDWSRNTMVLASSPNTIFKLKINYLNNGLEESVIIYRDNRILKTKISEYFGGIEVDLAPIFRGASPT